MNSYTYQYGFSEMHQEVMYDQDGRHQKAKKTLAVLSDFIVTTGHDPANLSLLDIGCSTGHMTQVYGSAFGKVVGIDIDVSAVQHAQQNNDLDNITFSVSDSMALGFEDDAFDCVTCTQIYEHVPDSKQLMSEIYRILKPGGICYFAAGNRVKFMEPHYGLPLLSIPPKSIGHLYVRLAGKADHYYETHLSYWGLRKLVSQFSIFDYTAKVIADPVKFHATELVRADSLKQTISLAILKVAYWLCPTYIWILRKPAQEEKGNTLHS